MMAKFANTESPSPIDSMTAAWLGKIDNESHARLAGVGPVEPCDDGITQAETAGVSLMERPVAVGATGRPLGP